MTRRRLITFLSGASLAVVAVVAAGCGGSGGGATAAMSPAKATIDVAGSGLGSILVDLRGRTLYLFKKDSATMSACIGSCATAWPPLLVKGRPTVGSGATASLIGTITRTDGTTQATYNGHPLYLFIDDEKPGETSGEGVTAFGAAWLVLSPAGRQIAKRPAAPSGSAASSPVPRSSASRPAAPKPATEPKPAPEPPPPAPNAAPKEAAPKEAAPKKAAPHPPAQSNGIPQSGGGDGDGDNNGGPSDGDGNV
jgi:predicted lipoprotein with Yx(FWY)xxD motif